VCDKLARHCVMEKEPVYINDLRCVCEREYESGTGRKMAQSIPGSTKSECIDVPIDNFKCIYDREYVCERWHNVPGSTSSALHRAPLVTGAKFRPAARGSAPAGRAIVRPPCGTAIFSNQ